MESNTYKKMVSFESVKYHLRRKTRKFDEISKAKLSVARDLLSRVSYRIMSENPKIHDLEAIYAVHPTEDLTPEYTQKEAIYFGRASNWIDMMLAAPGEFYRDSDAVNELSDLAEKLRNFYEDIDRGDREAATI